MRDEREWKLRLVRYDNCLTERRATGGDAY
jgi:hypothetical protein